jgi:hypothetical protein
MVGIVSTTNPTRAGSEILVCTTETRKLDRVFLQVRTETGCPRFIHSFLHRMPIFHTSTTYDAVLLRLGSELAGDVGCTIRAKCATFMTSSQASTVPIDRLSTSHMTDPQFHIYSWQFDI